MLPKAFLFLSQVKIYQSKRPNVNKHWSQK